MLKRLPLDIVRYIYTFDDTYKQYFTRYVLYLLDRQRFYPIEVMPYGQYTYNAQFRKFVCTNPHLT